MLTPAANCTPGEFCFWIMLSWETTFMDIHILFIEGTLDEEEKAAIKGKGIDQMEDMEAYKPFGMKQDTKKKLRSANDKTLIDYFCQLGQSRDPNAKVDLDFVDSLITNGANINCTDKHGQTLLHEVCMFVII